MLFVTVEIVLLFFCIIFSISTIHFTHLYVSTVFIKLFKANLIKIWWLPFVYNHQCFANRHDDYDTSAYNHITDTLRNTSPDYIAAAYDAVPPQLKVHNYSIKYVTIARSFNLWRGPHIWWQNKDKPFQENGRPLFVGTWLMSNLTW